jgi:ABC-type branched-subunit amino acid transport system substrate-binding protein
MITIAGHEAWTKAIREKLNALNIKIVDEQFIDVTAPDKTPFVTQMKSKNPDLVVMVDSSPGAARYVLEMQRQGWKPKLITGINTLTDEAFLRAVGASADGLVVAPSPMVPASDPRAKECSDALAASDKSLEPSGYSTFGCMGAKVFVEAMRRVGPKPTRDALRAELEKFSGFETGVSGPVSFGPAKRQGIDALIPIGIEGGRFKVLGAPIPIK